MRLMEKMARFCVLHQALFLSFAAIVLTFDSTLISAVSQRHRAAGVFMLIEGGAYTFNFSAARAACLFLNVTIATGDQMKRALQHGLETCKFGWTAEQIAVVPRLTSDEKCGKGKTGVVTWSASADRKFGVFCFNASDLEETQSRSTSSPQISTFSTTLTPTSASAPPLLPPTTKSPPSKRPSTTPPPVTSASTLPVKTTHSTSIPSTSTSTTLKAFSSRVPTTLSHQITSKPSVVSFTLSPPLYASQSSVSTVSVETMPVSPVKPSLGDVPTALIVLGIILLLLTAAGIVWYYKLNIFALWPQVQQKDDIETEMWKHTDSEMDLHSQHDGEEEEESDRKYSSDITLCVNPDMKINSSE